VFYPIFRTLSIVVIVTAFLVPIAWMILASIKSNIDLYDTAKFLVFKPTLENYKTVFEDQDFFAYFVNSLVVGVASTALSLVIAVPAAYSVARFAMRRSANAVLLARVIPSISLIVPWYFIFARLDLVGGYGAVVLAHMFTSVPLALWIMMSYFEALPTELEEAGQIDGLTAIGAFLRVTLPLSTPGVATAAILAFIFSWNNFLFSLVLTGSSTRTLPVAIMNFIGYASIDWGGLMAASTAITVPIMVIAIFFQKYVVSGLTAGAQKG
jgi:multiple sugar transport system permease protein